MASTDAENSKAAARLRGRDKQQDEGPLDREKREGVIRGDSGQARPVDRPRAQGNGEAGQNAGLRAQKEAAEDKLPSPGEPAGGE